MTMVCRCGGKVDMNALPRRSKSNTLLYRQKERVDDQKRGIIGQTETRSTVLCRHPEPVTKSQFGTGSALRVTDQESKRHQAPDTQHTKQEHSTQHIAQPLHSSTRRIHAHSSFFSTSTILIAIPQQIACTNTFRKRIPTNDLAGNSSKDHTSSSRLLAASARQQASFTMNAELLQSIQKGKGLKSKCTPIWTCLSSLLLLTLLFNPILPLNNTNRGRHK